MRLVAGNEMKGSQKTILVALVVLLLLSTYALIRTGHENAAPNEAAAISTEQATSVDQTTFLTAQALAHLPTSAAEVRLAEEALQLGDQDMDLAFASAVLDATRHPTRSSITRPICTVGYEVTIESKE